MDQSLQKIKDRYKDTICKSKAATVQLTSTFLHS